MKLDPDFWLWIPPAEPAPGSTCRGFALALPRDLDFLQQSLKAVEDAADWLQARKDDVDGAPEAVSSVLRLLPVHTFIAVCAGGDAVDVFCSAAAFGPVFSTRKPFDPARPCLLNADEAEQIFGPMPDVPAEAAGGAAELFLDWDGGGFALWAQPPDSGEMLACGWTGGSIPLEALRSLLQPVVNELEWEEKMQGFPSPKTVAILKDFYPAGTRVELLSMDDPQAPPAGTKGTVRYVDDAGQIGVAWDTGSSLSLVPGVDAFRAVPAEDEAEGPQP